MLKQVQRDISQSSNSQVSLAVLNIRPKMHGRNGDIGHFWGNISYFYRFSLNMTDCSHISCAILCHVRAVAEVLEACPDIFSISNARRLKDGI